MIGDISIQYLDSFRFLLCNPHSCREIVVREVADKFQPPRGFCWKYLIHIQIANWNRFISFSL